MCILKLMASLWWKRTYSDCWALVSGALWAFCMHLFIFNYLRGRFTSILEMKKQSTEVQLCAYGHTAWDKQPDSMSVWFQPLVSSHPTVSSGSTRLRVGTQGALGPNLTQENYCVFKEVGNDSHILTPVRVLPLWNSKLAIHLPQRRLNWFIQPRYEKDTSFYIIKSFIFSFITLTTKMCVQSFKKKKKRQNTFISVVIKSTHN